MRPSGARAQIDLDGQDDVQCVAKQRRTPVRSRINCV